jgi:hypothetical protein
VWSIRKTIKDARYVSLFYEKRTKKHRSILLETYKAKLNHRQPKNVCWNFYPRAWRLGMHRVYSVYYYDILLLCHNNKLSRLDACPSARVKISTHIFGLLWLNVYSLVCSNLSQPISTRRKHYFKYVRALNFANIFIARVKFNVCPDIFFQQVFSNKQHKLLHVI